MNKEFVSYKTALALKELGFDEPCFAYYFESVKGLYITYEMFYKQTEFKVSAPLYQQVFTWFREKHNLHHPIGVRDGVWFYDKWSLRGYDTYEEAESACLDKLIEIIKNR